MQGERIAIAPRRPPALGGLHGGRRYVLDVSVTIVDAFNRYGVQIMSPHYFRDPDQPKLVPEAHWHPPPVRQGDGP